MNRCEICDAFFVPMQDERQANCDDCGPGEIAIIDDPWDESRDGPRPAGKLHPKLDELLGDINDADA